jgi:hypothetical protein
MTRLESRNFEKENNKEQYQRHIKLLDYHKCKSCVYAHWTGDIKLFCPFQECLKDDLVAKQKGFK